MVHLFLINVEIPVNAQIYFGNLFQLITYNLVDTEGFLRWLLRLEDDSDTMPNFYYLGYHSVFFIINIGNMLFGIMLYAGAFVFVVSTRNAKKERILKLRKKVKDSLMWNSTLTFMKESLIIFAISCFLQYKNFKFKNFGQGFSALNSVVYGIILIGFLAVNYRVMTKYRNCLQDKRFKAKFGTIFAALKHHRSKAMGLLLEPLFG